VSAANDDATRRWVPFVAEGADDKREAPDALPHHSNDGSQSTRDPPQETAAGLRTRPKEGRFTAQNIDQPWEFINTGPTKDAADPCQARRLLVARYVVGCKPKLKNLYPLILRSKLHLSDKDGTPRVKLDRNCRDQKNGRKKYQTHRSTKDVDDARDTKLKSSRPYCSV
jgi:hypothetical protein